MEVPYHILIDEKIFESTVQEVDDKRKEECINATEGHTTHPEI